MNKTFFWSASLTVAVLTGWVDSAYGQSTEAPVSRALAALIAEAWEKNPELEFYRQEIAAAKTERKLTGSWNNPELSTTLGQKSVGNSGIANEGIAWSVSLSQPIEWPGRVELRKAIANHQINLAELGYSKFKSILRSRAHLYSYQLLGAQERAAAAKEVAERLQQLREVLVQREPAGLTPMLETRIIEATQLTLRRKSGEAELLAQMAMLNLNQLRGTPWTQPVIVEQTRLTFNPAPETVILLKAAQTNNFELQMRRVELEQQGFKVSLALKENYSSFTVGPYLSKDTLKEREQQIGVALSIPIPLWKGSKGSVDIATARQKQAETSLHISQREVEKQILERSTVYRTKLAEMALWQPDSVEQFRAAAAMADRHYRLGAVAIATYVELQKQYLEAIEALLATQQEALEAGQELQSLTGLEFGVATFTAKTEPKSTGKL